MNPKYILALLGIPSEESDDYVVDVVDNSNNSAEIIIEQKDRRPCCPHCGSNEVVIKDYYTSVINNSIIKNYGLFIRIKNRRYYCKKCKKSFKQEFKSIDPRRRITKLVEINILEDLKKMVTYSQVAKEYNLSVSSIVKIFDRKKPEIRLKLLEVLCIDEIYFLHNNDYENKYVCVLSNPITGDIVDIVYSRRQEFLYDYFGKIPTNEEQNVKYFISDMNDTYQKIKNHFFYKATFIIDTFHVVKLFTEALQVIRKRYLKNEDKNSVQYAYLKRNWKILLKRRSSLKNIKEIDTNGVVYDPTFKLDMCLKKYPDLREAYLVKEYFLEFQKGLNYYQACEFINFFIARLSTSNVKELNRISDTLSNWKDPIIASFCKNSFGLNLSNAIAEENNNRIRTLFKISYGFGDFRRTKDRILYIDRNRKTR